MHKTYKLECSPLYRLRNRRKLAELLNVPHDFFRKKRKFTYHEFSKLKSCGVEKRHFMNPETELKKIQKRIHMFLQRVESPTWVKSIRKGDSYIRNCTDHLNSHYVLTMDIAKFYESVSRKYVYSLFDNKFRMDSDISSILTNLIFNEHRLPTGGPSSQTIV